MICFGPTPKAFPRKRRVAALEEEEKERQLERICHYIAEEFRKKNYTQTIELLEKGE